MDPTTEEKLSEITAESIGVGVTTAVTVMVMLARLHHVHGLRALFSNSDVQERFCALVADSTATALAVHDTDEEASKRIGRLLAEVMEILPPITRPPAPASPTAQA